MVRRAGTRAGIYFIFPTHLVAMVGGARPHEARRRRCRRCPSQVRYQSLQPYLVAMVGGALLHVDIKDGHSTSELTRRFIPTPRHMQAHLKEL
eukprot:SAG31_NODE_766_length_12239_cov_16.248435_6_plen_93_part_00